MEYGPFTDLDSGDSLNFKFRGILFLCLNHLRLEDSSSLQSLRAIIFENVFSNGLLSRQ